MLDTLDPAGPPPPPPEAPTFRTPEEHLYAMAEKYGVDPKLALAVLRRESGGRQTDASGQPLQSSQGARGMFQLLPATAQGEFGLDTNDPFQNIEAGIRYLRQGIDRGDGTVRSVASYYHGGPNQQQWGPKTAAYAQGIEDDLRQQLAAAPSPARAPAAAPAAAPARPKPGDWAKPQAGDTTPAPPTPPWYQRWADNAEDVGIGALKGAGDTATNLGALVHKIPGVTTAVDKLYGEQPGFSDRMFGQAHKELESSNTAQTVGKVGEQLGELILPAAEVSKAATGAQKLAAPLASMFGKTAVDVLPRVAVEAAGGAGMAAAQGGDPTTGAAFGAAAPVIGHTVGQLAESYGGALRDKAGKLVEQAFGGTSQRYKAMVQKRVGEILDRGLWGSRKTMLKEAEKSMVPAVQAIDDVMQQHANDPFTGSNALLQHLETLKDKFRRIVPGAQGPTEVVLDRRPYTQLSKLQDIVTALGPQPTIGDMVAVRKVWDSVVSDIGGFAHRAPGAIGLSLREQTEEWAKSRGANYLRGLLGHDVPDLVKPNHEFSFWKDIADTLNQTMQRQGPQSSGIGQAMAHTAAAAAGSLAAAAGFGSGHGTAAGLVGFGGTELITLAHHVMTSPAWRMASAQVKNAFANALTSGTPAVAADIAAQILGTRASIASPPPPPATGRGSDIALPPPAPPR